MGKAAYLAFEPADDEAARQVTAELERNGWELTPASAELRSQDNLTALTQTISDASIVIVLASRAAEESAWTRINGVGS